MVVLGSILFGGRAAGCLGRVEVLVVGDDDGAFGAVDRAGGTPGADAGQAVGGEVAQLAGRGGEPG